MERLSLYLLGSFYGVLDQNPLTGFESNKVRALLAYLAVLSGRAHGRYELAGLLWPDYPDAAARKNLRQALNNLRQLLGDQQASSPFLSVTPDSIQVNPNSSLWLDVLAFRDLLAGCEGHLHRLPEGCHACARRREQAVDLYRGDFLAHLFIEGGGPFEAWAAAQRKELRRKALSAMYDLSAYYERAGAFEQMQRYAARQLDLEPEREEAHRQMMRALVATGQHSAALAQFEECCDVLEQELGVSPSEETWSLYHKIRRPSGRAEPPARRAAAPVSPLIGRQDELDYLSGLLENPTCRVITLTGMGGIGKTCLAQHLCHRLSVSFRDGSVFASLSAVTSAQFLPDSLVPLLSLSPAASVDPTSQVLDHLRGREMLLVLDNFEHLLPAGRSFLLQLLEAAPGIVLLVTSSERLNIRDEWIYQVKGLDYPGAEGAAPRSLESYSAIAMFVQASQKICPLACTPEEMAAIGRICRSLQGVPLAIELAASRLRVMPLDEIAEEIERGVGSLSTSQEDTPLRHQSIRAMFNYAWQLLSDVEKQAFSCISIFRGGGTRQAIEVVTGAPLIVLESLLDKSLLTIDRAGRYQVNDLLRLFGEEELARSGQQAQARDRLMRYYLEWVERSEHRLIGRNQASWMKALEAESQNLQATLDWSLNDGIRPDLALRLSASLGRYWLLSGRLGEGRYWLEKAIALNPVGKNADTHLRAVYWAALIAIQRGELDHALDLVKEAQRYLPHTIDPNGEACCLDIQGVVSRQRGMYAGAHQLSQRSLELFRQAGNLWGCTQALNNLFRVCYRRNEYAKAEEFARQSLLLSRRLDDLGNIATTLIFLGILAHDRGDYETARDHLMESLGAATQLESPILTAHAWYWRGRVETACLAFEEGQDLFNRCLPTYRETGNQWGISVAMHGLGVCALYSKLYSRAYQSVIEAIDIQQQMNDRQLVALFQSTLGDIYLSRNALEQAGQTYLPSLETLFEMEDWSTFLNPLRGLVKLLVSLQHDEIAARLAGSEAGIRNRLGVALAPVDAASYQPAVEALRLRLGPITFDGLHQSGLCLPPQTIMDMIHAD